MQERGHSFEVVSTATRVMDEVTFQPNDLERTIPEVSLDEVRDEFDALMIVSGNMADTEAYWEDPIVQSFVKEADAVEHPIAAICCSVPTIAQVCKGIEVSFFPLVRSRHRLEAAGAILKTVAMTRDGRIVTAEHQMATQIWANAFCDVLEGKETNVNLVDSGYVPKGRERKPMPWIEDLKAKLERGANADTE